MTTRGIHDGTPEGIFRKTPRDFFKKMRILLKKYPKELLEKISEKLLKETQNELLECSQWNSWLNLRWKSGGIPGGIFNYNSGEIPEMEHQQKLNRKVLEKNHE